MIESFIAVIIFALSLWYLGAPLFSKEGGELANPSTDNLRLKKEAVLSMIRDLELDFAMKKISDNEYQDLKNQACEEEAEILRKVDHD